jgi:hypothetical protein
MANDGGLKIDVSSGNIRKYAIHYWYLVVVFICVGCSIFLWQRSVSKTAELEELKGRINIQKSLDETNAKLNEVLKRENEIYPKLLETKRELTLASEKLSKIQNDIKLIGKDTVKDEVSKMDLNDISVFLNSYGYTNRITSCK